MLTLKMALGYTVTVPAVWLTPVIRESGGWGWTFVLLAVGPAAGVLAIRSLIKRNADV